MDRFKAVLFDLDGTLIDSLGDLAGANNAVLERHGFPVHPVEDYRFFVGDGHETMVRRSLPPGRQQDEKLIDACVEAFREQYSRNWESATRPYPGIPELLSYLAEREIPMAVLTNQSDDFAKLMVARFLAPWSFFAIRGALPGFPEKPHPQGALRIAAEAGIDPGQFVYLGDTRTDMQTANRAGMFAAGATWGFRPAAELVEHGAKVLLNSPLEVRDFFK